MNYLFIIPRRNIREHRRIHIKTVRTRLDLASRMSVAHFELTAILILPEFTSWSGFLAS